MREPWEQFFSVWREEAEVREGVVKGRSERRSERLAAATSRAARETADELRGALGWSLINTRILVGRFVEVADEWAALGSRPEQLRAWLREVWEQERRLCRIEEQRRATTEAILAGGSSRGTVGNRLEMEDSFAYELHAW